MKTGRGLSLASLIAKPDPGRPGVLLFGPDAMRVSLKRQDLVAAIVGPKGEEEMRLTRMSGDEVRRDPAQLVDALKAASFFPGPRAVLVDAAGEGAAPAVTAALEEWRDGDASLVVTAGALKPTSKLRKLFEGHRVAVAAGIYDAPMSREEIDAELSRAGISNISPEAMADLEALGGALDPGDFRQTLERLGLYKLGDATPLSSDDIAAIAPATVEAGVDELIGCTFDGAVDRIGPLVARLSGQGQNATSLVIAGLRHARALLAAKANPQGPASALARARPPVFGPRRDRMIRQATDWRLVRLETAVRLLVDTDLALRSAGQTAPQMAQAERVFIRLAMLRRAR
ncbi:DNA polymerase III subunit delta [Roseicyclus sp. F158]|uniref:DNA-directed DNA polymerase n=1 Tax=Tropicimonas omnivorans TaxID=3075590 RepID=A0ABU3DDP6_9RHOB|nr:DNA polymerase III subunit delta [Roseicyclus sp. F158]MDT0681826.1 DNA polymerase III subunit delta [Roseicyclus sp. F158]